MSLFSFPDGSSIGTVFSVDTATVIIKVDEIEKLRKIRVNQLVAVKSAKAGQHLIGLVNKITRKSTGNEISNEQDLGFGSLILTENILKVDLFGTLLDMYGQQQNVFKRNLDTVPEIEAECFPIDGENITKFMNTISSSEEYETPLSLGRYSIDEEARAYIDGDKLFQRHAVIVGSTGSGKSWSVAKLLEQVAELPTANSILFDIHGEYSGENFQMDGIQHLRIANPSDLEKKNRLDNKILMLPYWLLTYEEMLALLLDRSDSNAPNQAMVFSKTVFEAKEEFLKSINAKELAGKITIDSPVPYDLNKVLDKIKELDTERVKSSSSNREVNGPFHGKLTRFIQRLEAKQQDKRLGFLFQISKDELELDWMNKFCERLMLGSKDNPQEKGGVKIIDFSEVPSDVLPLVISLVARIIFTVQQWTNRDNQHPIALFCDEAHLYIPERTSQDSASELGLKSFERIAKEGRKYGVSLIVISQRPSEVNRTVLSQCNNFISLRLTNAEDQSVIKKLLPDNLSGLTEVLPILDIGEALVVGDSSLLPIRVLIDEPKIKPQSATIKFWKEWSKNETKQDIQKAVLGLRRQAK